MVQHQDERRREMVEQVAMLAGIIMVYTFTVRVATKILLYE